MDPIWYPHPEDRRGSHLEALIRRLGLHEYDELLKLSLDDPETFYRATFELIGIRWRTPYRTVWELPEGPEWPHFFPGGRLNFVESILAWSTRQPEQPAVIWEGEPGEVRILSYGELADRVRRVASGLLNLGLQPGERVGVFLPMLPEAALAALAIAYAGGILIPIFSGYGAEAAAVRLKDAEARWLISADGFYRRGKQIPLLETALQAAQQVADLRVIAVSRLGQPLPTSVIPWSSLEASTPTAEPRVMESMDPFMLLYTSGTTGRPKGTVHYHAGFPLKAAQDLAQCFDLRPGERLFWFTDLGWMMGPWAIFGALLLGATVVLYEGAPDYPNPARLWAIVEREQVTHLGVAPTVIRGLIPAGSEPLRAHDLSSLRILGSTGEPWNLDPYLWYFREVGGGTRPIINYSGGTEVGGGLLGCVTWRPIKPMSFNTQVPGIRLAILDGEGKPLERGVGELAVLGPWPGMTRGFWQAPERYLATYWRYPGVWVHGDWVWRDEEGYWYIQGRSDDTLKVAGKRVGPAELESAAVRHPSVVEAAAVGIPDPLKGEVPLLFVVLRPGWSASEELANAIRDQIAEVLGKALAPQRILFVDELPKTRNAKIMRRVLKAIYLGEDPGDLSALENPAILQRLPSARSQG